MNSQNDTANGLANFGVGNNPDGSGTLPTESVKQTRQSQMPDIPLVCFGPGGDFTQKYYGEGGRIVRR